MPNEREQKDNQLTYQLIQKLILLASGLVVGIVALLGYQGLRSSIFNNDDQQYDAAYFAEAVKNYGQYEVDPELVVEGIHVATGLKIGKGFMETKVACTGCHSPKLITQNKATRDGWEQMIRWMQATQGLQSLGEQEPKILDYLAANYAPEKVGRRANLDMEAIEWYILKLDQ